MPFARDPLLMYVGRGQYRVCQPAEYVGKSHVIHIPADTCTDLASVPRLLWAILPPFGVYERAAVVHDVLCERLNDAHRTGKPAAINSRDADLIGFERIMREEGVDPIRRKLLWLGVRYGALANPARRAGWWRDAPAVAALSTCVVVTAYAALWAVHRLAHALL